MTPRDFAYWLQGYFEILAGSTAANALPLNATQIARIRNHIALVYTTHPGDAFVRSIEAVLETVPVAIPVLLASYFEHVIDPQHPVPDQANTIHHGGKPIGSVVARC